VTVSFIGGGNWSTRRISPNCRKSRTNCKNAIKTLLGNFWSHAANLTPPLFIEVPVPSQESERLCICVLAVSILPLSSIVFIDFWKCSDSVVFFVLHFI